MRMARTFKEGFKDDKARIASIDGDWSPYGLHMDPGLS